MFRKNKGKVSARYTPSLSNCTGSSVSIYYPSLRLEIQTEPSLPFFSLVYSIPPVSLLSESLYFMLCVVASCQVYRNVSPIFYTYVST